MSDFLALPENIGNVKTLEILPFDEWQKQQILQRCDVVVKDGFIKNYPTQKIAGVQYYDKTETKRQKALEKEWKKAGGASLLYDNYVSNMQAGNMQAIEVNKDVTIDYNKGISDVQFRPIYFIGGAILLTIIVIFKNRK